MKSELAVGGVSSASFESLVFKKYNLAAVSLYGTIVFLSVVDTITSAQVMEGKGFTAGQVLKGVIFVFLFLFNLGQIGIRKNLVYLYVFFFYLFFVEFSNFLFVHHETSFFLKGLSFATKVLFLFFIYYFLMAISRKNYIRIETLKKGFYLYVLLFSVNILLPIFMGLSHTTYTSSGFSGFYSSGNELGVFVTIAAPALLYIYFRESSNKLALSVPLLILVVSGILTGAKTPLVSLVLSFVFVPILLARKKWPWIVFVACSVLLSTLIFSGSVQGLISFLPREIYGRLIWTVMERTDIWEILLGVRLDYFELYVRDILNRDAAGLLFGSGFVYSSHFMYRMVGMYKAAEMDGIDLMARYGIIGLFFVTALALFTVKTHYNRTSGYSVVLTYTFLLLLANSLLAGHVLGNAFSSVILGILFSINRLQAEGAHADPRRR